MIKKVILTAAFLGNALLQAQTGCVQGWVFEANTCEGMPFASIALFSNGSIVRRSVADIEGKYEFINLSPGEYDVMVHAIGCKGDTIKKLRIENAHSFSLNLELEYLFDPFIGCEFEVNYYCNPYFLNSEDGSLFGYYFESQPEMQDETDSVQRDSSKGFSAARPVPAIDHVEIEWMSDHEWVDIEIFDQNGRSVHSERTNEKIHRIGRAGWAAGQYTYHLSSGSEWIDSGKIIFQ